jgi:hypothetical protein
MKRVIKPCLVVLIWCLCLSWAYAADPAGKPVPPKPAAPAASAEAPVLLIPEATYDFGEAFEGAEVTHDFKIRNTGKGELQIEQVRPG